MGSFDHGTYGYFFNEWGLPNYPRKRTILWGKSMVGTPILEYPCIIMYIYIYITKGSLGYLSSMYFSTSLVLGGGGWALSRKLRAESKESPLRGGAPPSPPIRFPPGPQQKNGISACHCRLVILDICISFAALQLSTCSSPSTLYTRHHMPHSFSMSVASLRDYTSTHKVPQPSIHRLKHFSPISCMHLVSQLCTSILH